MDIKILEQYKLVLNNKKSYILVLNALPNYRSEKVQIGNDIFDFFLVYREKIQLTIDYSISITTEKEYQFEGKNIYFIPLEDNFSRYSFENESKYNNTIKAQNSPERFQKFIAESICDYLTSLNPSNTALCCMRGILLQMN